MAHSLRDSGAVEHGHASTVQETLMELAHLHELLLGAMADAEYKSAFDAAEPFSRSWVPNQNARFTPSSSLSSGCTDGWSCG